LPEGVVPFTAPVEIKKDGIKIQGAEVIETTITAHVSTTDNGDGSYDTVYTLSDATGVSAGQYLIVSNTIQDDSLEDPEYWAVEHEGCWEITNVSGNDVTVKAFNNGLEKILSSQIASASITILKTVLDYSGSLTSGLDISAENVELKDLAIIGQKELTINGMKLHQNATVNTENLGVQGFEIGINVLEKSRITQVSGQFACSRSHQHGLYLGQSSTAIVNTGIFTSNGFAGATCSDHSMLAVKEAVASGNSSIGLYCLDGSAAQACAARSVWNGDVDYAAEQLAIIKAGDDASMDYASKSPLGSGNNLAIIGLCYSLVIGA